MVLKRSFRRLQMHMKYSQILIREEFMISMVRRELENKSKEMVNQEVDKECTWIWMTFSQTSLVEVVVEAQEVASNSISIKEDNSSISSSNRNSFLPYSKTLKYLPLIWVTFQSSTGDKRSGSCTSLIQAKRSVKTSKNHIKRSLSVSMVLSRLEQSTVKVKRSFVRSSVHMMCHRSWFSRRNSLTMGRDITVN